MNKTKHNSQAQIIYLASLTAQGSIVFSGDVIPADDAV